MEENGFITIACLASLFMGMIIGGVLSDPNELENGCIVHNDKIYCEVGNEK